MRDAFTPRDMEVLAKIVDEACKPGCGAAQRELIASRVLALASTGTRDYDALLAIALFERGAREKKH